MAKNQYSRWIIKTDGDFVFVSQNGAHRVGGQIGEITKWVLGEVRKTDDVLFRGFSDQEIWVKGKTFLEKGLDVLSESDDSETEIAF